MYYLLTVKICQTVEDALCDFAKHFLSRPTAKLLDLTVHTVQAPTFAELHGYRNGAGRVIHKRTVVSTDVFRRAVLVEIELSDNLLLDIWVWIRGDYLRPMSGLALWAF